MAFRLLRYQMLIWDHWLADHPKQRLPPIYSMVLYDGCPDWNVSTHFHEMIDFGPQTQSNDPLRSFVPQFDYQLIHLQHASPLSFPQYQPIKITLYLMKYRHWPERLMIWLEESIFLMWSVREQGPAGLKIFRQRDHYIVVQIDGIQFIDIHRLLGKIGPHGEKESMTIAEQLRQEGIQIGREEGREEGRDILIQTIITTYEMKFGPCDDAIRQRLQQLSLAELAEIIPNIALALAPKDLILP